MPGNDMFVQTHSTPTTMDNNNNTYYYHNIKYDVFPSRFPISHRSPRPPLLSGRRQKKRRESTTA